MALTRFILLWSFLISIAWAVLTPDGGSSYRSNTFRRNSRLLPPCPTNCQCTSVELICTFSDQIDGSAIKVPNNIIKLRFSQWSSETVDETFFKNITNLRWLALTKGRLTTIPSMKENENLSYLDVSDNVITSLDSSTFSNNSYLARLNVSGNNISVISESFFTGFFHLVELDISRNPSILQIPSNSFLSCEKLLYLDLSFTGLMNISVDWTTPLQQLIFLNISHNDVSFVPQLSLSSLKVLDSSYNKITTLPKLSGLKNLTELYLSHTWICYLDAEETKGCNKLRIIDISYANLTNINENVLSNCKHFRTIDLSHNYNLYRIEHGALSGLTNLTVLRLNNCPKLNDLELGVFEGLTNLKELHLQDSGIQVLPSSLGELNDLPFVNLEGTNLRCDCYAAWLPTLLNTTTHLSTWKGVDPIQCQDGSTKTLSQLEIYHQELGCEGVSSNMEDNQWVIAPWNQSALLECNMTGNPEPIIIWLAVDRGILVYNKSMVDSQPWINHHINAVLSIATAPTEGKYQVLQSGQLLIRNVQRNDIGRYKCFAFNAVSNSSVVVYLGLQSTELRHLILESLLFGFACAALFLFATLFTQFVIYVMDRLGWECCCCRDRLSPKAKQIKQLIESVEAYKSAQLDRLKDNYNSQVLGIKEGCYCQMERLRDGYTQQSNNLKELRDYSTQQLTGAREQLTGARDQYLDQVNKCRDYSLSQMNRVRENYVFQRHRIRKFSGHQLVRLRDTYKYQQKTLNKLLETLPDLYIQNCRTGSCQRTDSMIFEDEIDGLDIYYKVDFRDTNSFNSSDYYTPCSTLTKQSKHKAHSRNESSVSGGTDYQEAQSWLLRQGSTGSDKSIPIHKRFHKRSFSLVSAPIAVHRIIPSKLSEVQQKETKGHKRSISAMINPSPNIYSHKPPLLEEQVITVPSRSPSFKSSTETPVHSPLILSPIDDKTTVALTSSESIEVNMDEQEVQDVAMEDHNDNKNLSEPVTVEQTKCQSTAL